MRLIDIVNGPWAILPDHHREIQDIYKSHRSDEGGLRKAAEGLQITRRDPLASAAIIAASVGRQVENRGTYTVIDNVAIIPIHDVISKRMSFFMEICGGCSSQVLMRDFSAAQNDRSIKGVILYADTPGGTVDGTMEAADLIASARGNKPVKAFTDGMVCSAGIWLVAGADEILISSNTNPIGSIGVVAAHIDVSKREEMYGRVITEITAGDYKRIASNYSPLTKEGRAYIQGQLDHIYTSFLNHVGPMRGLSVNDHQDWADGRVFLGSEAIDAGLVDGVSTMEDLINSIVNGSMAPAKKQKAVAVETGGKTLTQEEEKMDVKTLREQHPEVAAAIEAEARTGMVPEAAVQEERARVCILVSAAFGEEPGKKFATVVDSGLTAEAVKTLGISFGASGSDVDTASRQQILDALNNGGQQPLGKTETGKTETTAPTDFAAKVTAYAKEHGVSRAEALKACRKSDAKGYSAWIASVNAGAELEESDDE